MDFAYFGILGLFSLLRAGFVRFWVFCVFVLWIVVDL